MGQTKDINLANKWGLEVVAGGFWASVWARLAASSPMLSQANQLQVLAS